MVVGFKLPKNIIMNILNHLEARTITFGWSRYSKKIIRRETNLVDDCILWVANNGIFSIVCDAERHTLLQVKIGVKCKMLKVIHKGIIPIKIPETKKLLRTFKKNDIIEVIYDNGIILLKSSYLEDKINLETKRIELVRHDFYHNLKKQIKNEKDEQSEILMEFFKLHKSIYFMNDGIANVFGIKLDNYFETTFKTLKEIVNDELLKDDIYEFKIIDNELIIINELIIKESRNIQTRHFNFTSDFSTVYSSQFSTAVMVKGVKKLKENARLYFGEDKPLLLIKQEGLNKGINLSCLVMPYLHRN